MTAAPTAAAEIAPTAPLTAPESFLALLDDLGSAGAKPSGAAAAVMLAHAATHIRALLDQVQAMEREADEDAELDEVLHQMREEIREQAAAEIERRFLGDLSHPQPMTGAGPLLAAPDLSHLPPMAAYGEPWCQADSEPIPGSGGDYWTCSARTGHPERWHAQHHPTGKPFAEAHPGAAWPVAERETGLPNLALDPALACGAVQGRWACNAVQGHAPLDHMTVGPAPGFTRPGVLARWASVHPSRVEFVQVGVHPPHCECPVRNGMTYHDRDTCTDPVAAKLGWFADARADEMSGQREGRTAAGSAERLAPSAGREGHADEHPVPAGANGHAPRPPEPETSPVCAGCGTANEGLIDSLCSDCAIDAAEAEPFRLAAAGGGEPE